MKTMKKVLVRFALALALVLSTVNATSSYATGSGRAFYTMLSPFHFREKSGDTIVFAGQFSKMTLYRIIYARDNKEK